MPFLTSLIPRPTLRPMIGRRLAPKSTTITRMTQIHSGPGIARLLRIVPGGAVRGSSLPRPARPGSSPLVLLGRVGAALLEARGAFGGLLAGAGQLLEHRGEAL